MLICELWRQNLSRTSVRNSVHCGQLTARVGLNQVFEGFLSVSGEDVALASIAFHCLWYYYLVLQALEVSERLPRKFNIVSMSSGEVSVEVVLSDLSV